MLLGGLVFAAGPAFAQPIQLFRQPGNPVGKSMLMGQDSVQNELKLNDEQKAKFKELGKRQLEDFQTFFRELSQGGNMDVLRRKVDDDAAEINREAAKLLNDQQKKRLNQIHLQVMEQFLGLYYVLRYGEDVAEQLKIRDEQKDKIQDVQDELQRLIHEALRRHISERDQDELRKALEKLTKEANKRILALLDETQVRKLEELKGERFRGDVNLFGFPSKPAKPMKPMKEKPVK